MSYIPEKILYVLRPKESSEWRWDSGEKVETGIDVFPAFPVDPDKPKTVETALSWAKYRNYKYVLDYVPEQKELKNSPVKIKILSLEYRNNGGRAYKAVVEPYNYFVDLREDVLLDTILECGVEAGGIPNAEFIWARIGSEMKLVRVGSLLHKKMIQETKKSKMKKIPAKDIIVGGIYKDRSGIESLYLGKFWVMTTVNIKKNKPYYYGTNNLDDIRYDFEQKHCWISRYNEDTFDRRFYIRKLSSTKSVIQEVGVIFNLNGWKEKYQNFIVESIKQYINLKEKHKISGLSSMYGLNNPLFGISDFVDLHLFELDETPKLLSDIDPVFSHFQQLKRK